MWSRIRNGLQLPEITRQRHMIMNKDMIEHKCKAYSETFRKIQCLEYHVKEENVHTEKKASREANFKHFHNICVTMFIVYKKKYC